MEGVTIEEAIQISCKIPLKKKIIHLDSRIESFFDKFKNLKKFNQSKKKLHYLNSKLSISIALIVVLFFTYFFIPAFYNKDKIKKLFTDQISDQYDLDIKFNNQGIFKIKGSQFRYHKIKSYTYLKNAKICD